jgi:hypothetical protein
MFIPKRLVAVVVLLLVLGGGFVAGTYASAGSSGGFTDVPVNHPFRDEIAWMSENGIAGGYPDGTYRPGAPVTRAAMAAFMTRLSGSLVTRQSTLDPSNGAAFSHAAFCQEGERALTGSGSTSASSIYITDSYATAGGTAWLIRWQTATGTLGPTAITVYVLCAPETLG